MNSWLRQDSDSDSISKLSVPHPAHPRTSNLTRVGARCLCLLAFISFIALLTKLTVLNKLSTWSELTVIRARVAVYGHSAAGTAAAAAAPVAGLDTTMPKRHVVLPATGPNRAFCRCLFTLLINGYDAPTVVSWYIYTHALKMSCLLVLLLAMLIEDIYVLFR